MTQSSWPSLGDLDDPYRYRKPLDTQGHDPRILRHQLSMMLLIRRVEERIGDAVASQLVRCPCHLGIGQEAVAVGVSQNLRSSDYVFGGHRSHSHYLALGGSPYGLFAEILGKDSGSSKGMGGSMHLYDASHGFQGSVPIVAATIPLAAGAALAARKKGSDAIAVAYFGDGAAEEGSLHETLNFASRYQLPILFVCENNLFSSHLHIDLRQPARSTARFACAHRLEWAIVDGNDVLEVQRQAGRLVDQARRQQGPGFLEAVTYRWRGHVGAREDLDVGVKRRDNLQQWKARDPIRRLVEGMQAAGLLGQGELEQIEKRVADQVRQEWKNAQAASFPPLSAILERVYKN